NGRIEGEIVNPYHKVAFRDICAAWFRRSRNIVSRGPSVTSTKLDDYVKAQSLLTLTTLFECLPTLWVGNPQRMRRAEVKALQLAEANKAGLMTPRTLISNDPVQAAAFVRTLGEDECAVKPLIALGVQNEQGYRLPLTTTLPKGYALDSVALAPTILQPYIEKAAELRCVVLGERIFCAKLNSQANENTRKDWRGGQCTHELFTLPEQIQTSIHRMMHSLGINFASMDFILTRDGEFVFLEVNPNGQWLWLEEELGLPLVASMVDLLTAKYTPAPQPAALGAAR
ncbi:MAG: hypothetical protein ACRDG4_19680, partial [Chloroflexota bacterium]